ncbi:MULTISPECIES: hypothetical protein [unclassified Leptospira]|uniref:hypothetical protein n=1 Tax=unclassified Leptospira TaxID=2633828 RepID=UPI0002BF65D4|nr:MULTISPECIES: hypothetical protein [unclassified Leptospira]EMK02060.1 hypothetical protein LEP1GSC192_1213 [Leptospira sp. B5-022]MCR1795866.1 hypothetical protein [Leptospira sp. id769339]
MKLFIGTLVIITFVSCSSALRDYDLISQGISSQYQLFNNGETEYFDSMLSNGSSYSATAFFIGNDQLSTILNDQNNKDLTFYDDPKAYGREVDYLLWEICGSQEKHTKRYSFNLNGNLLNLLASYDFPYPYRMLGTGKRRFFPRIPAEEYVNKGKAAGVIPCSRYVSVVPTKLNVEGKNTFEIRHQVNKIYVFTYFYRNGFIKYYKKML